jgi:hypothetical protein
MPRVRKTTLDVYNETARMKNILIYRKSVFFAILLLSPDDIKSEIIVQRYYNLLQRQAVCGKNYDIFVISAPTQNFSSQR